MKKFEITKEQILKMAESCPTAKDVLKAGFPSAFENEGTEAKLSELIAKDWLYIRENPCSGNWYLNVIIPHGEGYVKENGKIWKRKL